MPKQQSIFHVNIKNLMLTRGLKPTPSTLVRAGGFSFNRARHILYGGAKYFHLLELERLCFMLHCTPADILKIPRTQADKIPAKHPLQNCLEREAHHDAITYFRQMPPEKLQEAEEYLRTLNGNL